MIKIERNGVTKKMRRYLLLLIATFFLASCSSKENEMSEEQVDEDKIEQTETDDEEKETVIKLDQKKEVNNQVMDEYFSDLSAFPTEKGRGEGDKEGDIYWIRSNGFPVRGEEYFSSNNNLTYAEYDADTDQIEVANILNKNETIQDIPLEEDLYVSWTYDFAESELKDLVQVNTENEPQDFIHFTEEEWKDFSTGYKENLMDMLE